MQETKQNTQDAEIQEPITQGSSTRVVDHHSMGSTKLTLRVKDLKRRQPSVESDALLSTPWSTYSTNPTTTPVTPQSFFYEKPQPSFRFLKDPRPSLSTTTRILNTINDSTIFVTAMGLSLLNGYIYFSPGKNALEKVLKASADLLAKIDITIPADFFQRPSVINFNLYVGLSGFIANTLLAIETLTQLLHHRYPIAYKEDIPAEIGPIFTEIISNLKKNLQRNLGSTLAKFFLTVICMSVIIPFSYQTLSNIFKDTEHPYNTKVRDIIFALFGNIVAAAIYGNGWRTAPKRIKTNLLDNDDIHLWNEFLDLSFNLLTARDYKQELIKAYNGLVINEVFTSHARTNIKMLLKELAPKKTFAKQASLEKKIEAANLNSEISSLLIRAQSLNIDLLKETAKEKLHDELSPEDLEPVEFITKLFEKYRTRYNDDYCLFYITLFQNYFDLIRDKLKNLCPEKDEALSSIEFNQLAPFDDDILLHQAESYQQVCNKIKALPEKEMKNFIEIFLTNMNMLRPNLLTKIRKGASFTAGFASAAVTTAAGIDAGGGMFTALFGEGHPVLKGIFGQTPFGASAFLGRGPLFGLSVAKLSDHYAHYIPYNANKIWQDTTTLWQAMGEIVTCRFNDRTKSALVSIGYITFQIGFYHLSALAGIAASPLGIAGVCASALENLGGFFYYLILPGILIAYAGGLVVNFSSALNFAQRITNILLRFWDTILTPFLNRQLNRIHLSFDDDKQYYWETMDFLSKQASKFIKEIDDAIANPNDNNHSTTYNALDDAKEVQEESINIRDNRLQSV